MRCLALNLLGLLLLLAMSPLLRAAVVLEDDFDDGVLDPMWTLSESGNASFTEAGGVASASTTAGSPGGSVTLDYYRGLLGDLDVCVDYDWAAYDATSGTGSGLPHARTALWIWNEDRSDRAVVSVHLWGSSGGTKEIIFRSHGSSLDGWLLGSQVPLAGKIRLRREDEKFYGYYWASNSWQLLGTGKGLAGAGTVEFGVSNYDSSPSNPSKHPSFQVNWDNFHAEAEGVVPEPSSFVIYAGLFGVGILYGWRRRRGPRLACPDLLPALPGKPIGARNMQSQLGRATIADGTGPAPDTQAT